MSLFSEFLVLGLVVLGLFAVAPSTEPTTGGGEVRIMSDGTPPPPPK